MLRGLETRRVLLFHDGGCVEVLELQFTGSGEGQGLFGIDSLQVVGVCGAGVTERYEADVQPVSMGFRTQFALLSRVLGVGFTDDQFLLAGRQLNISTHGSQILL